MNQMRKMLRINHVLETQLNIAAVDPQRNGIIQFGKPRQDLTQQVVHVLLGIRLYKILRRPYPETLQSVVRGGGRKDDHAVLIKFPQLLRNFNAVGTAHENVQENDCEGLLAGSLQKGFAALKFHNLRLNAMLH